MQKMKRHRIPFGIWPYEVVRPLQAIQDDSSIKFTETNYRSGTKRKTTFFLFLGIVTLIGNLARKLLCFLVFRLLRTIFHKSNPSTRGVVGCPGDVFGAERRWLSKEFPTRDGCLRVAVGHGCTVRECHPRRATTAGWSGGVPMVGTSRCLAAVQPR